MFVDCIAFQLSTGVEEWSTAGARDPEPGREAPTFTLLGESELDKRLVNRDSSFWEDSPIVPVELILRPCWLLGGGGGFRSLRLGGLTSDSDFGDGSG